MTIDVRVRANNASPISIIAQILGIFTKANLAVQFNYSGPVPVSIGGGVKITARIANLGPNTAHDLEAIIEKQMGGSIQELYRFSQAELRPGAFWEFSFIVTCPI